jgi:hypothetical protein
MVKPGYTRWEYERRFRHTEPPGERRVKAYSKALEDLGRPR